MPRRPRPGEWKFVYAEVSPEDKARLEQAAEMDGRSVTSFITQWIRTLPPLEKSPVGEPKRRGKKKGENK